MKAAVFSAVLLLLGLFSSLAAAEETYRLEHLEQEAQKFAVGYARSGGSPPKPEEAAVLLQAAKILTAADDCSAAVGLHKQAAGRASQLPADFWVSLAKAAGCANDWAVASQSGWTAYLAAGDSPAAQQKALELTGKALENRITTYYNWTPAAISVYELLARLAEDKTAPEARLAELRQKFVEENILKINEAEADASGSQPKLCLKFNEELPSPDDFHYGDYIQVEPAISADFSVDNEDEEHKLCIGGGTYGTSYTVTVRSGMKAQARTLPETASLTIETEHREPSLWFNQSDYVLADRSNRGIGLNTVNVDKVRLKLFRIHERNILGDFVQENFRKKLSSYDLSTVEDSVGEQVWQGSTEITPELDKVMTSAVVLPQDVLAVAPGLYVLVAERIKPEKPAGSEEEGEEDYDDSWEGQASQWVVVSDIGLSTYQGSDGLTVAARSLDTALPIAGLEIGLYARNNSPLGILTTDEQGVARFAPGLLQGTGGQAAFHLMSADSKHGFTFLQLEQAPFDLSDRGVSGRTAPGPLDAYVYTERGIYRPGETVHLAAIVRDRLARSAAAPPMTLHVSGPDGKVLIERLLKPDAAGGYADNISLANAARSGIWTAALYADVDDEPAGQTTFQVKSFKPPRLEVRMEPNGVLDGQSTADVAVQADYFYGSPGSELAVKAKMKLEYEPHPFTNFADYYFGKEDVEPGLAEIELNEIKTDAKGHGLLPLSLSLDGQQNATLQPLKAVVSADVLDIDGRAVNATATLPVRHLKEYLGVKPGFADLSLPESSEAKFEVLALDDKGQPQEKGQAEWRLVREEIDYQWFRKDGEWAYEQIVRDQEEQRGQLAWDKAGPQPLAVPTGWGQYRIELLNKDKVLLTTLRFTAGEQLVGESETPDSVKVVLDRSGYKVGETAKLTVTAPYPGQASLVLANTAVNGVRNFALSGKEQTVDIPVEEGWGAGVYALVTVYRPGKDAKKGADRAVGLVWLPVDPADRRLEVAVNAPEQVRPRQVLQVPVSVKGAEAGSEIRLTLAAVDEGVLQLTNFVSPDPIAWFFAKPQLGMDIRDMYGQLIIPPDSKPLVLRSGAGEDGLRGAPQSNVKVVSLFSGVVQAGADGTVSVPLDIPDFNGRLRLMAVAWSKEKTGAASKPMQVNDPVVVSPSLPRYLADGDKSSIQLLIENIDGPAGQYQAVWTAEGAVRLEQNSTAAADLQPKKRQSLSFPVTAVGTGSGKLKLAVSGPEGYSYTGAFDLNVRGKYLPTLTRTYSKLDPGAVFTLDQNTLSGLYPANAKVAVSVSSMPNVDVAGLLGELDRYPHGCLEQLTSRAMPLLYANQLGERFSYPADKQLSGRVRSAIELILQKQRGEGSFGLWSDESSEEPWLSAYAMDFLGRAKEKGFDVPDYFYKKGLDWLTSEVKRGGKEGQHIEALAYAHWVLARAGQARHEDARYLYDTKFDSIGSPLAQAQLAGTLALLGDQERAMNGLKAALQAADTEEASWWSYGSRLRDLASVISIIGETGLKELDPAPAWQELTNQLGARKYLSTQEQAALIMAALTLDKGQPLDLEVTGNDAPPQPKPEESRPSLLGRFFAALGKPQEEVKKEPEKKSFFALSRSGESLLTSPVTLRNKGQAAVWLVTTVQGAPISEPAPVQNGFTVRRSWFNTAGKPLALEQVPQSTLAVVVAEGEAAAGLDAQSLLIDLLPAGFEIEKAIVSGTDVAASFSWLPELTAAEYTDARDDRFIAAFSTQELPAMTGNNKLRPFRFAYLVRAVTPGSYALPPAEVEAMYRPEYRARNKAGAVTVVRAQ